MNNEELCFELMSADSAKDVISLLEKAGYWDDDSQWRYLGDTDMNYSSIGNQQSEAVASLIEKIVNGVDARLTNACLEADINPESSDAPQSIRMAVAQFFEGNPDPDPDQDGRISRWDDPKVTAESLQLTVSATGYMPADGDPCISIADQGEGQTPDKFPDTFLSLLRGNKKRVLFVQGKFNMGGTGALQFCAPPHRLQLIVSRRNPALLPAGASARDAEWGFTIVRREPPREGERSSSFTYLAPVDVMAGRDGSVLSFAAESLKIFPEATKKQRGAYLREAPHGTLIKLYEYIWQGTRSNVVSSGGGLLRRIDLGLPELALPVRVFECRPEYRGHHGSFATNVMGIIARLERDRADKLEEGFPLANMLTLKGSKIPVRVFAFKKGAAKDYRTSKHGVVFGVNGQSHGTYSIDFFRRRSVGMSYLADSLLVMVDCSQMDEELREDLFMNSRDRLKEGALAKALELDLETLLREDQVLKNLRNARREADINERLEGDQPLVDVLGDLLEQSPTLAKLFLMGKQLPSPFPRSGTGPGTAAKFEGRVYPTYFRFKGLKGGEDLVRTTERGRKVRISFETDAIDEYFLRDVDPGDVEASLSLGGVIYTLDDYALNGPQSGLAHLSFDLPDVADVGDVIAASFTVSDASQITPFGNNAVLSVTANTVRKGGRRTVKPETATSGKGDKGASSNLALPEIVEVEKEDWAAYGFDENTGLVVKHARTEEASTTGADDIDVYDFYINVDNKYLRIQQKESKENPKLLRAKFTYALVLVGLAMLKDAVHLTRPADDEDEEMAISIEELIQRTTASLSQVILPTVDAIGGLTEDALTDA